MHRTGATRLLSSVSCLYLFYTPNTLKKFSAARCANLVSLNFFSYSFISFLSVSLKPARSFLYSSPVLPWIIMETRVLYVLLIIAIFNKVNINTNYYKGCKYNQYKEVDGRRVTQIVPKEEATKHSGNKRNHQNDGGAYNRIKAPDGLFNFIHVS